MLFRNQAFDFKSPRYSEWLFRFKFHSSQLLTVIQLVTCQAQCCILDISTFWQCQLWNSTRHEVAWCIWSGIEHYHSSETKGTASERVPYLKDRRMSRKWQTWRCWDFSCKWARLETNGSYEQRRWSTFKTELETRLRWLGHVEEDSGLLKMELSGRRGRLQTMHWWNVFYMTLLLLPSECFTILQLFYLNFMIFVTIFFSK